MTQDSERSAFSRRTVVAAIQLMERLTQTELTRCLLRWGPPDLLRRVGDENISVSERLNNLIILTDQEPACKVEDGDLLCDRIVDQVGACWSKAHSGVMSQEEETFRRAIQYDGFHITDFDGTLRRIQPADARLPSAEDNISRLLEKHRISTARGHMKQALDAHGRGDWAAANSQIRTFLDSLLDEIAERLDPSAATLGSGQVRRTKLAAAGFLIRGLNEWDDNGLGFLNGLIKRLHPHGAHPGLSDEDDSTFRLQVVLLTARLLLSRFDSWPGI